MTFTQELKMENVFLVKTPLVGIRSIGFVDDNNMQIKVRALSATGEWYVTYVAQNSYVADY
jgi:hypothetical protein